jgi:hypothetical protein
MKDFHKRVFADERGRYRITKTGQIKPIGKEKSK